MKRKIKTTLICALFFCLCCVTAFADMGSKPRVEITLLNKPDGLYYLDLLIKDDGEKHHNYTNLDSEDYTAEMIKQLFSHQGWRPVLAGGVGPISGDIIPNEKGTHIFGYYAVPEEFRIIIVTESGEIKVSDTIKRTAMELSLTVDYADMSYTAKPFWQAYTGQFLYTCPITLLVEFIIFLLFRFKIKGNLMVFVSTNIFTQIVFTALFSTVFVYYGTLASYLAFILLEIAVTAFEAVVYRRKFTVKGKQSPVIYAVVANLVTACLTWVNLSGIMEYMFKLIR